MTPQHPVVRALPHPRPGLLETVRGLPGDLAAVDRGVHALFPGPETGADLHPARRHRRTGAGPAARGPGPRDRPDLMLDWLKKAGVRRTLQAAAGHSAVTHEAPGTLPPGRTLVRLRSMLVAAGALPARDERLVTLERWIGQVIAGRTSPEHRRALHGYAVWHQLRRLRSRLQGRPASGQQVKDVRDQVTAAAAFLDWLEARGLTLGTCTRAELDQWLAGNSSYLARSANFAVGSPQHARLTRPLDGGGAVGRRAPAPARRHLPGRRPGRRAPHPALRPEAQCHRSPDDSACPA